MNEKLTKDHISITIDNRNQEGPWDNEPDKWRRKTLLSFY
jgi:hypothetical protein